MFPLVSITLRMGPVKMPLCCVNTWSLKPGMFLKDQLRDNFQSCPIRISYCLADTQQHNIQVYLRPSAKLSVLGFSAINCYTTRSRVYSILVVVIGLSC